MELASVRSEFWGMPRWPHHCVLLFPEPLVRRTTYFIDGQRPDGILSRHFPLVILLPCSRTGLAASSVELRILQKPVLSGNARVIGKVFHVDHGQPEPGASVTVDGPQLHETIATDSQGIYEVTGLRPGDYVVRHDGQSCTRTVGLGNTERAIECNFLIWER